MNRPELEALRAQGLALRAAGAPADQQAELERRIVELVLTPPPPRAPGRLLAACLGAALLLAAAGYAWKGNPAALSPVQAPDRTEEMVQRLASRLQQQPQDPAGWAMLGRSYAVLGRMDEAVAAYRKAVEQDGANAELLADFADVRATGQGGSLEGEPAELLARALQINPDSVKALALAGTRALRAGDKAQARVHWERLLKVAPQGHPLREMAERSMGELAQP
ncbi:tetratricopeptide repeat protein [Inhella proteolytica]|uniref:Tetratricopeptide repeat protein n=1 Tax=Inhella proteolytica TaxID=2795029 RepID=A0A931J3E9_9BURK|nr:tetratricopeptide repeat protein [Inhella proteolytica]MBH9577033.1 tetratricopeptide repeat protein [Inhella proteolytica]